MKNHYLATCYHYVTTTVTTCVDTVTTVTTIFSNLLRVKTPNSKKYNKHMFSSGYSGYSGFDSGFMWLHKWLQGGYKIQGLRSHPTNEANPANRRTQTIRGGQYEL